MKNFLLMLLGVLMTLPTFARDFTYTYEGQTLTYTVVSETDKTCMTKAGTVREYGLHTTGNVVTGDLVIPSKANDGENNYTVTSIGDCAFCSCYGLTSVKIPDSVTSIGSYAFNWCSGLTSVTIPGSVTSIGDDGFYCSGLEKAEFESIEALCSIKFLSGGSNPLYDAHHLYINGKEITELVIPSSVTSIGDYAFIKCSYLTSVTIPSSVTSIGNYAFNWCSGLTSIAIPDGVTSIGTGAFEQCSGLTSITIPGSVTSIGDDAFLSCHVLEKAEFESIEALCRISFASEWANPLFYVHHLYIDGEEITELVIPGSVTSIGDYAFAGCYGLTSVTIPDSVTSIGDGAFKFCRGLTSVTIPGSVTSIGSYAFAYCSGLTSVTIPDSVTSIGYYAFQSCDGLTSVTIPASVTSMGSGIFSNCSNLTSVIISDGVTSIGYAAFKWCESLTSVTIPSSVTSIGARAFERCESLTSVYYGADNPIAADANVFSTDTYEKATLYMSEKGASIGGMMDPWKNFKNIEEYEFTGVEEMEADINPDKPYEVYDLKGAKVGDNTDVLTPGLYIVRQGNAQKKVVIK